MSAKTANKKAKSRQVEPALRATTESSFTDFIGKLEEDLGGRIGVYAFTEASSNQLVRAPLAHRSNERFSMASTFKWMLAAAVLQKVDARELNLEQPIAYTKNDIISWAPVTEKALDQKTGTGSLSLREMLQASVQWSDNPASNLLIKMVDGPSGLTAFARTIGDESTRLDRWELELNENAPGDVRDTTTPVAMAHSLQSVLGASASPSAGVLSPESRKFLVRLMSENQTGGARFRAGLPPQTLVADKTGSGPRGAINDIGFFELPSGERVYLVVYQSGSQRSFAELERVHARVAKYAYQLYSAD
ncbi:MAG: class A beta-lactamase [Polyangiaceae bacterium]|nr:class A beta-lactamase [Polyangiaceae bacterium]